MNFAYLKNAPDFAQLYTYCCEAEEFALSKPNISVTSARKAMEFIVKMIYSAVSGDIQGKTVFEMSTDYAFTSYLNDQILLNSIHFIRKMGMWPFTTAHSPRTKRSRCWKSCIFWWARSVCSGSSFRTIPNS